MIPVTLQKYYIRPKETGDWLEGSEIWGAGRIVAHTEVIPERHSLAAESEFSSEIATSNARHSIALRPSPVKSCYRNVAQTAKRTEGWGPNCVIKQLRARIAPMREKGQSSERS